MKIAPSILAADFAKLGEEIRAVEQAGADLIHIDVMDGHFVPNITIGAPVVKSIRPHTKLPLDVHLMIENPKDYIKSFADAGADIITVHAEACEHNMVEVFELIRSYGVKAGLSLKPSTVADVAGHVFDHLDLVLVMTVEPGFGGQEFLVEELEKIHTLRKWIDEYGHDILLEVDGGVNLQNISDISKAGADICVAGSAVFGAINYHNRIADLKLAANNGK